MKKYSGGDIERFLRVVDTKLAEPYRLVVVGGSAAALAFQAELTTADIDTVHDVTGIQGVCRQATVETGLRIMVNYAAVVDAPYAYEERLERVRMPALRHLSVWAPEKHDLALMKVVRGDEHDYEHIEQVHRKSALDVDVLTYRFRTEMGHVIGRANDLRLKFLALIERLFGEAAAEEVNLRLSRYGGET